MEVDTSLRVGVDEQVYEPSDDSYLLIDLLEVEEGDEILEVGCGSGIISLHCAKAEADVTAVDISEEAVRATKKNAEMNDLDINVKYSDLFSSVKKSYWDGIIFNPPYLPKRKDMGKDPRWDGGKKGTEVLLRFLYDAKNYLKDNGSIYICYSDRGDIEKLEEEIENIYEIKGRESKNFRFETIYAVELNLI